MFVSGWFLMGESLLYLVWGGVWSRFKVCYVFIDGGFGVIELVVCYEEFDYSDNLMVGCGIVMIFGVNWYLNNFVCL